MTTKRAGLALLAAAGALVALPAASGALQRGPVFVASNPSCAEIQRPGEHLTELKLEPVRAGDHTITDGWMTVTIHVDGDKRVFSWSSNHGVDAVIAKAGSGSNVYRYDPEGVSGIGLHAPVSPNGSDWYELSHISICYDEGDGTAPGDPGGSGAGSGAGSGDPSSLGSGGTSGGSSDIDRGAGGGSTITSGGSPAIVTSSGPGSAAPPATVASVFVGPTVAHGTSGCATATASAIVTGTGIDTVSFTLDGRQRRVVRAAGGRNRFSVSYPARTMTRGVHRIVARVVYARGSGVSARTYRLTFHRCARTSARFTG